MTRRARQKRLSAAKQAERAYKKCAVDTAAHYCIKNQTYEVDKVEIPDTSKGGEVEFRKIPGEHVTRVYAAIQESLIVVRIQMSEILGSRLRDVRQTRSFLGLRLHPVLADHYLGGKAGDVWTSYSMKEVSVVEATNSYNKVCDDAENFLQGFEMYKLRQWATKSE